MKKFFIALTDGILVTIGAILYYSLILIALIIIIIAFSILELYKKITPLDGIDRSSTETVNNIYNIIENLF